MNRPSRFSRQRLEGLTLLTTKEKGNSMPRIKFPVLKGNHVVFPRNHICPGCRKRKLGEPPGMAILNAGAMRPTAPECYTMATDDAAFMTLIWHSNDPSTYDDTSSRSRNWLTPGNLNCTFARPIACARF